MFSNDLDIQQLVSQGNNLVRELNTCLHTTTVQNKEENQMRELHSWACSFHFLFFFCYRLKMKFSFRRFLDRISPGNQPFHIDYVSIDSLFRFD